MTESLSVAVVGHVCLDMTHVHKTTPLLNGKSPASETDMILGGCAANTARFLEELGANVTLFSVLGDETSVLTQTTVRLLNMMGVTNKRFSFVSNTPATVSHVWLDQSGNRTISSYQNPQVTSFAPVFPEPVLNYKAALFDNYRWPLNLAVLEKLSPQCLKVLDVDAPVTAQQWELMHKFDHIWFSAETFREFKLSLSETAQITRARLVGVTDGENPVVWVDEDGIHKVQPPSADRIVSTLGAGDAFRAGVVWGLINNQNNCASVRQGCQIAVRYISNEC